MVFCLTKCEDVNTTHQSRLHFYRVIAGEITGVFKEVHQDIWGAKLLLPVYTSVSFSSLVTVAKCWFFKGLTQCLMKGYKSQVCGF